MSYRYGKYIPLVALLLACAAGAFAQSQNILITDITLSPPIQDYPGMITGSITVYNNTGQPQDIRITLVPPAFARYVTLTTGDMFLVHFYTNPGCTEEIRSEFPVGFSDYGTVCGTVGKKGYATFNFYIRPESGYFGPGGIYSGTFQFNLYRIQSNFWPVLEDIKPVSPAYQVENSVPAELILSTAQIQFGLLSTLSNGFFQTAQATVKSPGGYRVTCASSNGGYLVNQADTSLLSKIPYAMLFNNTIVDLGSGPAVCMTSTTGTGVSGVTYDFRLTIGTVLFDIMPGDFTDNLTFTLIVN